MKEYGEESLANPPVLEAFLDSDDAIVSRAKLLRCHARKRVFARGALTRGAIAGRKEVVEGAVDALHAGIIALYRNVWLPCDLQMPPS